MFKKPEKIHQWLVLLGTICVSIGCVAKIAYDVEMNSDRSKENERTNQIIQTENAVIKNELKHINEKLDQLLERQQ